MIKDAFEMETWSHQQNEIQLLRLDFSFNNTETASNQASCAVI